MSEIFEETITLAPGASSLVSFSVVPSMVKRFSVRVDGLSGSFEATAGPPPPYPDIVLSGLVITPAVVEVGDTVTISVTATNRGTATGTRTITLEVV